MLPNTPARPSFATLRSPWLSALLLGAALLLPGCGSDLDTGDGDVATGSLLPWKAGNVWKYRVTDPSTGVVTSKTTTVYALEAIPGWKDAAARANRVETRKGTDETDKTVSWQGPDPVAPERILRYREESYGATTQLLQLAEYWEPPRIHIDGTEANTKDKAEFPITYRETKLPNGDVALAVPHDVTELWTVMSVSDTVQIEGAVYENTLQIRKSSGGSSKYYWYARGVGKVKETGGQTEELISYTVN